MGNYYIDIVQPSTNLDEAFETIGKDVAGLYKELWGKWKSKYYEDAPFELNINGFANMWFSKNMKVFIVRDKESKDAIGFFAGVLARPMPYEAMVMQVQDYYVRGDAEMEKELLEYVVSAIRILGCDEVWIQTYPERKPNLGEHWDLAGEYPIARFIRKR